MLQAYYALFMSLCFQGASAITAYREVRSKARKSGLTMLNYVRTSADPSLNVVLLEDTAAVSGVRDCFFRNEKNKLLIENNILRYK